MNIGKLKNNIKQHAGLKKAVHRFIMHPVKTRPNWWIRLFYFIYLKRGKGSVIYRSVRKAVSYTHLTLPTKRIV